MTDPSFLEDVIKKTCEKVHDMIKDGRGSVNISMFRENRQRGAMISFEKKERIVEGKKNVDKGRP